MQLKLNNSMEIKILEKKENPLFNRREVTIIAESDSSLKISDAENLLAEKFSSHADNIKIRKIAGKFGSKEFLITANIYHSKEDKDKTEHKKKEKKNKTEEKK